MALQVRLSPSDILAAAVAIGLASTELASHHTIFTLNNMVRLLVTGVVLQSKSATWLVGQQPNCSQHLVGVQCVSGRWFELASDHTIFPLNMVGSACT
jgi:hypothetical protein